MAGYESWLIYAWRVNIQYGKFAWKFGKSLLDGGEMLLQSHMVAPFLLPGAAGLWSVFVHVPVGQTGWHGIFQAVSNSG